MCRAHTLQATAILSALKWLSFLNSKPGIYILLKKKKRHSHFDYFRTQFLHVVCFQVKKVYYFKKLFVYRYLCIHIFKDFIYLSLERGEGREKERERTINVWLPLERPPLGPCRATQACALTGNQTGDL